MNLMDDYKNLLDSIAKQSSCADRIPEGSLEPITEPEVEEAYRKDLEQILGNFVVKFTPTEEQTT
jgi:hypothetical protein